MSLLNRWRLYRALMQKNPNASRRDTWRFTGGVWH